MTAPFRVEPLAPGCARASFSRGVAALDHAAVRAARSKVAVFAQVVDAKDDNAARFHRHHGFELFGAHGRQLVVPLKRFITSRTTS